MSVRSLRGLWTLPLALSLLLVACGGDPPEKEIQQAESAIAEAVAAGAERYASEELSAARHAMQLTRDAVAARDYRLALNHALDGRDRAQTAASQATSAMVTARSGADMAIGEAVAAIAAAKAKLAAAETARLAPRLLAEPREAITHAEAKLQEARTAWDSRDYAAVTAAAGEAAARTRQITADLEELSAPGKRRR